MSKAIVALSCGMPHAQIVRAMFSPNAKQLVPYKALPKEKAKAGMRFIAHLCRQRTSVTGVRRCEIGLLGEMYQRYAQTSATYYSARVIYLRSNAKAQRA